MDIKGNIYRNNRLISVPHLLIPILLIFFFNGCSEERATGTNIEELNPTGMVIGHTGCKSHLLTADDSLTPSNLDCIEYEYTPGSVLLLKHINAAFNCCPTEVLADITIENGTITVVEREDLSGGGCACLCLFDVDYRIENLSPGEYRLVVVELYVYEGDEKLEFTIDLGSPENSTSREGKHEFISKSAASQVGSYCVERDHYPWGQ
ncbi:MAG: hypothetical protein GTO42_01470 [Candidatus Latescibacteria bacterium]|nr:hypothetical protein [Candidatus Latescibacterota bacterium]NIO27199.1 hypothetical protein [Candidatus Latescibacterota bacterium]NIO54723.1 hypothetical protein [Candidatus Latescibacterota bacterium]NIT00806.1 hypothetical protein [Candidatus Latescibacterota bacterium]NIT37729.1 hypothetical protein [Candidatus Latescibacterota bacterium]